MTSMKKRVASGLLALSMVAAGFAVDIPSLSYFSAYAATEIQIGMDASEIWVGTESFSAWVSGNPNNFTWSSENTAQVKVTKNSNQQSTTQCTATVTPVSKGDGTCKIYATDTTTNTKYELELNLKTATSSIKVTYNGKDITDNTDTIYVDVGEEIPLTCTIDGDDEVLIGREMGKSTFNLGDNIVSGYTTTTSVIGKSSGTATLTCASTSGSKMRTYKVVTLKPTPDSAYIKVKGTSDKSGAVTTIAGSDIDFVLNSVSSDDIVKWRTNKSAIATVESKDDNSASVSTLASGTCTLYADVYRKSDNTIRFTKEFTLYVQKNIPATGLSFVDDNGKAISELEIVKESANSFQLNTQKTPSDTTDTIAFTSDNTSVVTVDSSTGTLKAVKGGEAWITASTANGISAKLKVTVRVPVTSLSVDTKSTVLPVGQSIKITTTAKPDSADSAVLWTSSDLSVATVDAEGNVTAKKAGTATITARAKYVKDENSPVTAQSIIEVVDAVPTTSVTLPTSGNYVAVKDSLSISATCKTASGKATNDTISWTVKDASGNELAAKNDYATIVFDGTTATITGKKSGKITLTVKTSSGKTASTTVYVGKSFKNCTILAIPDQPVTGKELKPSITVKDGNDVVSSSNYTVTYSQNINKGTAKVTVTGKSNYCPETITKTFKIVANPTDISKAKVTLSKTSYDYTGKALKPTVTITYSGKTITTSNYTVSYSNNVYPGTATVTIKGKGDDWKGTVTKTFTIKGNMSKVKIGSISNKTYTGKAFTPSPTVKLGTKKLVKGTDYTITYSKNTNPGIATVTFKGKGNYTGSVSKTFIIKPMQQKISSLKSASKGFKVTYKKDTSVTGYQIQYSTSSKFSSVKTKKVTSKNTNTLSVSGLKAKKTYYVRVRSYVTTGGKTYYGVWSTAKKVTTKK